MRYFFVCMAMMMMCHIQSQITISGKILGSGGEVLAGASVLQKKTQNETVAKADGTFSIRIEDQSPLTFSFMGYDPREISIEDLLQLESSVVFLYKTDNVLICIAEGIPIDRLLTEITIIPDQQSSSTVTQLTDPAELSLLGTADILANASGIFADAATGEVFSRVYSRGISLSAEDDIGWFYNSLQEDGMPITMINYNQFSPDLFHRPDISVRKTEIYKGGKSGILVANSPGTVVNFISRRPSDTYSSHDRITTGIHQNGNSFVRIEGYSGGPFGRSKWSHDMSYLYRYDRGNRNLDYAPSKGGQMSLGLYRAFDHGLVSLKSKYLQDRTNRYTGIAAINWENPQPAFGQHFQTTSLLPPSIDGNIADGRTNANGTYEFDPANGVATREWNALLSGDFAWTNWSLSFKSKLSFKKVNWQTAIGGQPLGLENFISYFISGDSLPAGIVEFIDTRTGSSLATVNNAGMLNAFQGQEPTFEYLRGNLTNDAIMGTGAWYKNDQINEWMNDIHLTWIQDDLNWTIGAFGSKSSVDAFTNASFIYSTYEARPRTLEVTLTDFEGNRRKLSDDQGLSNYGGLLYEEGSIDVDIYSLYSQLHDQVIGKLWIDLGLRFDHVNHIGLKYNSAPITLPDGGADGDLSTSYDRRVLGRSGSDDIDFNYNFLSWSAGISYELDRKTNLYGRISNTHKSPELNYYFNNFSNVPIDGPGEVQNIFQLEFGIKKNNLNATVFYSQLSNVAYSNFEFDDMTNSIFYLPTQLNSSQTIGLELEYLYRLSKLWSIDLCATIQDAQLKNFSLYRANGTIDQADDTIETFDENKVPHQANLMSNISLKYNGSKWEGRLTYRYLGDRYGNFSNAFTLPSYARVDLQMQYNLNSNWYLSVLGTNLLNTGGLNNFFGPNQFGSNSDAATEAFIQTNPNASFVVFPISGRTVSMSVGYRL